SSDLQEPGLAPRLVVWHAFVKISRNSQGYRNSTLGWGNFCLRRETHDSRLEIDCNHNENRSENCLPYLLCDFHSADSARVSDSGSAVAERKFNYFQGLCDR